MATVMLAGAGLVALCAVFAHHLPVLIHGTDTRRMASLTAPVTLPLVVLALAASWSGTRRRKGPENWCAGAVLVCLCDLVLTYSSRYRFSLGWYAGRGLTLIAAGVVLFAMLAEFRRLKKAAEFNAAYDSLTGLPNRRSTHDTLDRLFAASRRSKTSLGVLALDLDWFKEVNDQHGHAAGDRLLTSVGAALAGAVRGADLVGRVDGEEFLALLPDTGCSGSLHVAERLRLAVALADAPGTGRAPSVSIGVACLTSDDRDPGDLLRRTDAALYRAKAEGRNRVHNADSRPPAVPAPRRAESGASSGSPGRDAAVFAVDFGAE